MKPPSENTLYVHRNLTKDLIKGGEWVIVSPQCVALCGHWLGAVHITNLTLDGDYFPVSLLCRTNPRPGLVLESLANEFLGHQYVITSLIHSVNYIFLTLQYTMTRKESRILRWLYTYISQVTNVATTRWHH